MRPPTTDDSRRERYAPPSPLASSPSTEPTLAERLARALDMEDIVTVVGLLSLTATPKLATLPPALLERLCASTSREISAACRAKAAPAAPLPVAR